MLCCKLTAAILTNESLHSGDKYFFKIWEETLWASFVFFFFEMVSHREAKFGGRVRGHVAGGNTQVTKRLRTLKVKKTLRRRTKRRKRRKKKLHLLMTMNPARSVAFPIILSW